MAEIDDCFDLTHAPRYRGGLLPEMAETGEMFAAVSLVGAGRSGLGPGLSPGEGVTGILRPGDCLCDEATQAEFTVQMITGPHGR